MSIPLSWVEKIFQKLILVYGRDFLARWEGVELADVKADWAAELAGFERWPEAIAHAIANLPPAKPPTALEFRDLARKAPRREALALPDAKADPERMAAELGRLAAVKAGAAAAARVDHKAWARRLLAREAAGERLKPAVSKLARAALPGGVAA